MNQTKEDLIEKQHQNKKRIYINLDSRTFLERTRKINTSLKKGNEIVEQ